MDKREIDWSALERMWELPNSALLTTRETAQFLRRSVCALETMRRNGTGPAYIQHGTLGMTGANQKCLYLKADLLAWLAAHKVSSTTQAARRKGQL